MRPVLFFECAKLVHFPRRIGGLEGRGHEREGHRGSRGLGSQRPSQLSENDAHVVYRHEAAIHPHALRLPL